MAQDQLLLSDGVSNLLLSDGVSVLLLSTSSGAVDPAPAFCRRFYTLNAMGAYRLDSRKTYRSS